tara:strand:+ start:3890 stop:4315 length:426 start_codon:yes stop_codon:yes gene_type:complete
MTAQLDHYFDNCLYFSLSKMHRQINALAEHSFKKLGIAPSYAFLIMYLAENDKVSSSQVAAFMGNSASTITRFADKLIDKGLCTRTIEGRMSYLQITKKGRDMLPQIEECWCDLFNSYNEIYGKDEAKTVNDMIANLNKVI